MFTDAAQFAARATPVPARPGSRLARRLGSLGAAIAVVFLVAACDTGVTDYGDANIPDHLSFESQPDSVVAGEALRPLIRVAVRNANGEIVRTDSAIVTITSNARTDSGFLFGRLAAQTVDGIATFDSIMMKRVGSGYRLSASTAHVAGALSDSFAVRAGAAAKLEIEPIPTTVVAGDTIKPSIRVIVRDQFGNLVTSFDKPVGLVIFANPAGGNLRGTTIVTAVNGVAIFNNVNINRVGSGYVLRALDVAGVLQPANSLTFAVTPGVPTQLFFTINPPSAVTANDTIRPPMEVTVVDSLFNTVTAGSAAITISLANKPAPRPDGQVNGSAATLSGTLTVNTVNGVAQFKSVYFSIPGLTTTASPFRLSVAAGTLTPGFSSFFSAIP